MSDGIRLAATLYLPDPRRSAALPARGAPLPQGRPDLVVRRDLLRLRDEFGYAVCRLDLRGTGSSEGDATDEYPEPSSPTWSR